MPGSRIASLEIAPLVALSSARAACIWAGLSLVLSGAACLMAQVIIQKYLSVLFGGMAAPIMYVISFSFIAGLGAGSLVAGNRAARFSNMQAAWFAVNLGCALLVAAFLPSVTWIHSAVFPPLASAGAFDRIEWYYSYVLLLQFLTSFLLAAVMGMNYPIAFETLTRHTNWERRNVAIFVLVVNTAGAAFGSIFAERISKWTTLLVVLEVAAATYLFSAFFPLLIARTSRSESPDRPKAAIAPASLNLSQGCFFLFVAGLIGFACETLFFRHYGIVYPQSHSVFGIVLCLYLVLWSAGVLLARSRALNARQVFCGFYVSIALAGFVTLFNANVASHVRLPFLDPLKISSIAVTAVFFLPALFSGWFYSQVHNEMSMLDTRKVARLYFSNLSGSFVGGIIAGYLFPSVTFSVYCFVFLLLAFVLASICFRRSRLTYVLGVGFGIWALLVFVPETQPHLRYYRSLANAEGDLDVAEDWTTSCWVDRDTFFVGGKVETPDFGNAYGGWRLYQVGFLASLRENERICYIGIGLGVANGRLGALLPHSRIDNVDYSPAISGFLEKYARSNDDLLHQPNSRVILRDGRLVLMLTRERFDVTIEIAAGDRGRGSSAIKSVEFLQLVKSRLRPGGIYVGATGGRHGIAAAQKVFANVYAFAADSPTGPVRPQDVLIAIASDGDLRTMIDPARFDAAQSRDAELREAVQRKKDKSMLVKIKPISGRYVRDIDPCADYFALWEPLETADFDFDDTILLPF